MAIKRFYREVTVESRAAGHGVALDGRAVRTPQKAELALPTRALAEAVAAEWDAQSDEIAPQTMPMMQLASTAVDRVRPRRDAVIGEIASYAETDLLCYRADGPTGLVARQASEWQPVLDWAAGQYDALLAVTEGVMPVAQPRAAVAALRAAVAECDEFVLAALYNLTIASGSLVLALAVRDSAMDPESACDASQLDEEWQASEWGRDPAAESRRARARAEILAAARFLALLQR
jgi:chaperone required for assembly of F1-ATPase